MKYVHPIAVLPIICLLLCMPLCVSAQNHVLSLDGDGDYVRIGNQAELVPDNFTIEAWVKPQSQGYVHVLSRYDNAIASYEIYLRRDSVRFTMAGATEGARIDTNIPQFGIWVHMAMTFDGKNLNAYLNGSWVDYSPINEKLNKPDIPLLIGASRDGNLFFLHGLIDEVRIWSIARSQNEIRASLGSQFTGDESGLIAYWDFEGEGDVVLDRTGHGHHGNLEGDATRVVDSLPIDIPRYSVLSGVVHDEKARPASGVDVWLQQGTRTLVDTWSGDGGKYRLVYLPNGPTDLYTASGTQGALIEGLSLKPGESRVRNLSLRESVSVEGHVLYPDGTPCAGTVVQAVMTQPGSLTSPAVMASALTDGQGLYQFVNLKPGDYQVRCHVAGRHQYHESEPGRPKQLRVDAGQQVGGINFRVKASRKGTWRTYTHLDGLPDNAVSSIHRHSDGTMWVGTDGGMAHYQGDGFSSLRLGDTSEHSRVRGIEEDADGRLWFSTTSGLSCYDGMRLEAFTSEDGLVGNNLGRVTRDSDGRIWVACVANGTSGPSNYGGGVSRWDGQQFTSLTVWDGLATNRTWSVHASSDGVLWIGIMGGGVSRYDGTSFTNFTAQDGLAADFVYAIGEDKQGMLWFGTNAGVSRYDGREFTNLTTQDGLPSNTIYCILSASDGSIWFGTTNGVSRYNGACFTNFTPETELGADQVYSILEEGENIFWLATNRGVVRYDAGSLVTWTARDGLPSSNVRAVHRARNGTLWFGTDNGLHRYSNETGTTLTQQDGLAHDSVRAIYEDDIGRLWIGTQGGVSRYEENQLITLGHRDNGFLSFCQVSDGTIWAGAANGGLGRFVEDTTWNPFDYTIVGGTVYQVYEDRERHVWAATHAGIYRYDGESFSSLTALDGLAGDVATTVLQLPDGTFWFGTNRGVSHYDGTHFTNYRYEDGLASDWVSSSCVLSDGKLCFGTYSGGISLYDGTVWSSLDSRDGLPSDQVVSVSEDIRTGALWIATDRGAVEYGFSPSLPSVVIDSVTSSEDTYSPSAVPKAIAGSRITVRYSGMDYKTYPGKRQYRWRIDGTDSEWRKPTKSSSADFVPRGSGTYTFQVQSIDRDLNYSESESLVLTVVHPFYLRAAFLVPTVGGGSIVLIIAIVASVVAIRRRRQVHAYERYAVQELQDARAMQMRLLPDHAPIIDSVEIAGRCVTANTVGGDFFDYLAGDNHCVGLVVADVSGKAMRGAMNAVMAAGIVRMAVEEQSIPTPSSIMVSANNTLATSMESDMNVTMVIALLDTQAMTLTLANAAHHAYPLLLRNGEVMALKSRGLPLGMKAGVEYREEVFGLQSGDLLVLMTDGIIEAHDSQGRMYGDSGRLERMLTGVTQDMSAESMVDAIISDAIDYAGGERDDDTTTVVARIG